MWEGDLKLSVTGKGMHCLGGSVRVRLFAVSESLFQDGYYEGLWVGEEVSSL